MSCINSLNSEVFTIRFSSLSEIWLHRSFSVFDRISLILSR